jgi:uncharacterized protein (DUF305 family)
MSYRSALAVALALGGASVALPALAQLPGPMPMHGSAAGSMPGGSPADTAMMAGMTAMDSDMSSAPMTGNPDHDFVAMMIPHHRGAIDMAKVELQYGKDPAMRSLARDIVAAQDREIALMKNWQAKHPAPAKP